jgi:hypothetical protein
MTRRVTNVLFALAAPMYLIVGYVVAQIGALNIVFACVVMAVSLAVSVGLVWSRFTPAGRRLLDDSRKADWSGTFVAAVFLGVVATAGFTVLSTQLYLHGVGTIKGGELHDTALVDAAYSYYLWHLADAVPLLKVPQTLNWKLSHPFTDSTQGSLVLIYKTVVVLPLLFAVTKVVVAWTSDPPPPAGTKGYRGRPRPNWRSGRGRWS